MKKIFLLILLFPFISWATEEIPSRAQRTKAFEDSGLLSFVLAENMDELDQDLLYMRARKNSAEELRAFYPKMPKEGLRLLKKEAL